MPYINQEERVGIDEWLDGLTQLYFSPGTLNYTITKLLLKTKPQRYGDYNDLVGVLECVKLELYRRMIAPFEDKKKIENGDVYSL